MITLCGGILVHMKPEEHDQAMALSFDDRKTINELIKENLETTKKSGLPFF
jgi:hypothetical protein